MRGTRNFCQFYLVLSLSYSLQRGSNGYIAEKTILILYQGSRGGPLFVYENVKYQHSAFLYVFYLSGENKICSSAKLGVGLCISSFKTKYLR